MDVNNKQKINVVILKELVVIGKRESDGWEKILTVVKWFNNSPTLDIRYWSPDRTQVSKGSTLSFEELSVLCDNMTSNQLMEHKKEFVS